MRPAFFLGALLLVSLGFAFPLEDYLYYNESLDEVVQENFTYNDQDHTLIKINDREIFLLRNDTPLENATRIDPPLRAHYRSQYYLEESELTHIRTLLTTYNDSRNNGEGGGIFQEHEEATCRQVLFLDGRVKIGSPPEPVRCVDDDSCLMAALLVYQAYGGASAFGSVDVVIPPLTEFAFASQGTEDIMNEAFARLTSITDENVASALQYIQDAIPTLHTHRQTIETSYFRTPLNNAVDQEACRGYCYPICPRFDYNESALDTLTTDLNPMLTRIRPLAEHQAISLQIQNETHRRLSFRTLENRAVLYSEIFSSLHADGEETMTAAEDTLSIVLNLSLQARLDRLEELDTFINQSIERRNFTRMDDALNEYEDLMEAIEESIPSTLQLYNQAEQSRQEATVMLMLLETRDIGPEQAESAGQIRDYYNELDVLFQPGLTSEDYVEITDAYAVVSAQSRNTLKAQDENPIYFAGSKFRGFTRRVGRSLTGLLTAVPGAGSLELIEHELFPLGIASISFLSLTALGATVVISVLLGMARLTKMAMAGSLVAVALIAGGALAFSGLFYHFLTATVHDATLNEFLFDLGSRNETVIAVDTASAGAATDAMLACANSISASLAGQNKSVSVYELGPQGCALHAGEPAAGNVSCTDAIEASPSLFVLNYSDSPSVPRFSTLFVNAMEVRGDNEYYDACAVSLLFKG